MPIATYNESANDGTMPSTALTLRLENALDSVLRIEQALYKYEGALGEYTIPGGDPETGSPEPPIEGRPTVNQYLTWLERALFRAHRIKDNLNNIIL